ncbi:MAG: AMP-binding protein [Peptococcaceae bacterium]|nr:AMP-binding protein [Peptococcaceae bacterium]
MERIWYKYWPSGVPRVMEYPRIPLMEYVKKYGTENSDRIALNFYGKKISYGEFNRMVDNFASFLAGCGVKKGDRVSVFMDNCPQFIISLCGAWKIGAVAVPANPLFNDHELAYELADSGAGTIILLDSLYPVLHPVRKKAKIKNVIVTGHRDFLPIDPELPLPASLEVPRQFYPDTVEMSPALNREGTPPPVEIDMNRDLALLIYTSGTTRIPVGAMITHSNIMANTICSALWKGAQGGTHLAVLPLFHATGLVHSMNTPLYMGGTIVLLAKFDTESVMKAIEKYRCTHWVSIAAMNIAVVNHPEVNRYDLTSLKACSTGGAPVPGKVVQKFEEITGCRLIVGYGLSETISQITINPFKHPREGSVGIPVINTDVKIVDLGGQGREVAPGEPGELLVKGPQVMAGYWGRPVQTAEVIREGWLYTGDVARMDSDGYIYILGRKKEMILVSGCGVFPSEVEDHLYQHPAVAEVAVVGRPDPVLGEAVKAYVVLKREYENRVSERDILAWARDKMPPCQCPSEIEFMKELPRTGSGKILRRLLADMAGNARKRTV